MVATQRPVGLPRIQRSRYLDHVGQAYLVALPVPDRALGRRDHVQVGGPPVPQPDRAELGDRAVARGRPLGVRVHARQDFLGPVHPGGRRPLLAAEGQQVHRPGLVVKADSPVGEDHRGVRVGRAVPVVSAGLGLELITQVADPSEREAERKRGDLCLLRAKVGPDPVEERTPVRADSFRARHRDAAGSHVGRDGPGERPRRVAHEGEPPLIAVAQAAIEPEAAGGVPVQGLVYLLRACPAGDPPGQDLQSCLLRR